MIKSSITTAKKTIVLLGASFSTGNLGVSALAWSSIKLICERWPDSDVVVLGVGRKPGSMLFTSMDFSKTIPTLPIRYCLNVFTVNHISGMVLIGSLCRLFPFLTRCWAGRSNAFGAIVRATAILDITGGDSFSDIYGLQKYVKDYLLKRVCQITRRPYVLMPQTYGPFKSTLSQCFAKIVLKNSRLILSRDAASLDLVKNLVPAIPLERLHLSPDVAFILEPHLVDDAMAQQVRDMKTRGDVLIGLNVSGLLYHNGYTGQNEFGLALDYKKLLSYLVTEISAINNVKLLLVPHVIPCEADGHVESDMDASMKLVESLDAEVRQHVILVQGDYDQCGIKHLIGQCDFFMGSRMHATIASLSQKIPTVGLAYSKKFLGVYESIGMGDCVLDLREMTEKEIVKQCLVLYDQRENLRQRLSISVPEAQKKIRGLLENVEI